MSAIYRVRQFVRAAGALVQPEDAGGAIVGHYLPPAAGSLFWAMPRYDRRHALNVFHTLQGWGHTEPDLLAAALLHDVGKTARPEGTLRLWHRVATVLIRAWRPDWMERIGQERPGSWRYPFFVQQHHAAIGAELAQEAGCSAATVEWILRHEDPLEPDDDPSLVALQAADRVN